MFREAVSHLPDDCARDAATGAWRLVCMANGWDGEAMRVRLDDLPPSHRRGGFAAIGQISYPPPVRIAALCPCPVTGCNRCCCGVPECVNRLGGHPRCRCEWVDISTLGAGQCFQDSDEGFIGVIWTVSRANNKFSEVRRVYTVDEDSEMGEIRIVFHNEGNLVKLLPSTFIPVPTSKEDQIEFRFGFVRRIRIPKRNISKSVRQIFAILQKHGLENSVTFDGDDLNIPVKIIVNNAGKIIGLKDRKDYLRDA